MANHETQEGRSPDQSERRFKAMVERGADAVTLIGADGKVIYEGPTVERITGYSPADRIGKNGFSTVYAEDLPVVRATMGRVLARAGHSESLEFRGVHASGRVYWIQGTAVNLLDDPDVGAIIVNYRDITERREAEDALRRSEAKFRAMFMAVREVIVITTVPEGKIVEHNGKVLGYGPEELIGQNTLQAGVWADPAQYDRFVEEYRSKGFVTYFETTLIGKDGQEISAVLSSSPLSLGDKPLVLTVIHDVTEQRRAESERQILERQAQHSQKLEALGILAGGIAHDFNNLLVGVYGYVDLARNGPLTPQASKHLDSALASMERTRALTQQLLTFSKGGVPLRKPGKLSALIKETASFVLSGSSLATECLCPEDLWTCEYDSNQIAQVVDNLLINAMQAMPEGGKIIISAGNERMDKDDAGLLPPGRYVKVCVSDTGVGIPEGIIGKIFDPFFTTKQAGSGLGLATSYSIIKRHGGDIRVDSIPGKGSTFTFYLPASESASEPRDSSTPTDRLSMGSGTILVMDDDKIVRDVTSHILTGLGFTPICVTDGESAVKEARVRSKADGPGGLAAAILDLTVPGAMGGKDAAREIAAILPEVPLIVASGYASDPVMADPAAFGFRASVCKPFTISSLAQALRSCLHSKDRPPNRPMVAP